MAQPVPGTVGTDPMYLTSRKSIGQEELTANRPAHLKSHFEACEEALSVIKPGDFVEVGSAR